jgi:hypothetical protein
VPGTEVPPPPSPRNRLTALRALVPAITGCSEFSALLERTLDGLGAQFGITHAMILFADEARRSLYTVASRGYPQSGIGSEVPIGRGVIGVAAEFRTPIRIAHTAAEYSYSRAIREHVAASELAALLETEIPFPGLAEPHSQLSVPIIAAGQLRGVLHVESPEARRFSWEDEDALVAVAALVGEAALALQQAAECHGEDASAEGVRSAPPGAPLLVRHFAANHSVFLGDDYLIKGVAGAIFWRLVNAWVNEQRSEFSNRELRLDRSLNLPDIDDNLEARLILLQRRLAERQAPVTIEKAGRGRFRLAVRRPLLLQDAR